jgi:hypothetical protein
VRVDPRSALILAALGGLLPSVGTAAPCTAGTDCYCDKVKNPGHPLYDASLLFCEDLEAPTLTKNQGVGGGAPYYGPWYDDSGMPGNRGNNSYWSRTYGNGSNSFLFEDGEPTSPTFGSPCTYPVCTGTKVWDSSDRWSANNYGPQLAIYDAASDFTAELGTLAVPTNAAGGTSGIFDGSANLVHRIAPGRTHGISGAAYFPSGTRTIGLTMALAYAKNALAAGIIGPTNGSVNASWKHNEWMTTYNSSSGFDGLFVFYNQQARSSFPFAGFLGSFQDQNDTHCSGATTTVGSTSCIGGNLGINWAAGDYNQATDFPTGAWGCVRGFIENAGTTNQRMRIWFQGPPMASERLILDFTMNATLLDNKAGYQAMLWNAYANTNQDGYVPSTQLTFRYEDNVHARAGLPVSCAQIGFVGGSGAAAPGAPTNLRIVH